jgi:hypothetical protein
MMVLTAGVRGGECEHCQKDHHETTAKRDTLRAESQPVDSITESKTPGKPRNEKQRQ